MTHEEDRAEPGSGNYPGEVPCPLGFPSVVMKSQPWYCTTPLGWDFPLELLTCPMSGFPWVVLRNKPRLKPSSKGQ